MILVQKWIYSAAIYVPNCESLCAHIEIEYTEVFEYPLGVRQGCVLSPFVFSFSLIELVNKIKSTCGNGIRVFPNLLELFLLSYEGYVVALFSDTVIGSQNKLIF